MIARFIALLLAPALAVAQVAPASEKKDLPRFSPEVEVKFVELLKKLAELKSKDETGQLKKEIADVVKITGLDDAGQKALEKPAAAAVEIAVKDWLEKTETLYRTGWTEISPELIEQWIAQASAFIRNTYGNDYVRAAGQPAWKESLAQALDPKQTAAWKAAVDEQEQKFDEQIKGFLSATKARIREQHVQAILGAVSTVALTLKLDEERKKKLEKIAEQAADKASDPIKEKARKMLRNYDEIVRKQILKQNSLYFAPDENDAPEKQEVWKNGLKQILQPEEIARWEAALEKRRERRLRALAQAFVWSLDQVVAFTARQREQLLPLAGPWVQKQKGLLSDYPANTYYNVNLQLFYQAAAQAKEEDLAKILDPKQVGRWMEAAKPQARRPRAVVNSSAAKAGTKPVAFEPEELEASISDYLFQMAEREQERAAAEALLQAEDAIRVAALEGKAAQRLQTAARGAMEEKFETWKVGTATNIRAQLQNAMPADFQQRMANMGFDPVPRRRTAADKNRDGVWEKTVAAEMTDAQRAAWQKEVDARKAYERQTIGASVLARLDQLCVLTEEQWGQLEPVLMKQLEEYGPEFDQMFSNRGNVWFLQYYNVLTPLAGIPEKDMRKILSDEQWKQTTSADQFSNALSYWKNIEMSHKQRVEKK